MADIAFEGAIIFALILANGFFAMSEIALVSARKSRLKELADRGNTKAAAALDLAHAPEAFLSTVQVGITLVGVLAGAFGGATVAGNLGNLLQPYPRFAPYAEAIGVGAVVLAISYFSLILGELVPKRIALSNPERIASAVAVPMRGLVRLASPMVRLLTVSSSFVLRLLRVRPSAGPPVTEEEIKVLLAQGAEAGTFERAELDIVRRVFRLADRHVASVMTPRNEVIWMDLDQPPEERRRILRECGRSQFPVARGTLDAVQGILRVKDWLRAEDTPPGDEASLLQRTLFVPETTNALDLLELFQKSRQHIAVVLDEHGGTAGLVTLHDILEAIVGGLPPADEESEPLLVKRADGSWLVDGSLPVSDFKDALHLPDLPQEAEGRFQTVGGLIMYILRQVPRVGDVAETTGLRLEVVDMDGRRVDKVLVSQVTSIASSSLPRSS